MTLPPISRMPRPFPLPPPLSPIDTPRNQQIPLAPILLPLAHMWNSYGCRSASSLSYQHASRPAIAPNLPHLPCPPPHSSNPTTSPSPPPIVVTNLPLPQIPARMGWTCLRSGGATSSPCLYPKVVGQVQA